MTQARPPFDFDLNELPPEEDGANDAASPGPAREPLQQDPPSEREPLPPPPPLERESSPQDLPPPLDLDLEAPLSPLDEDEDDADGWQLPGPPSRRGERTSPRGPLQDSETTERSSSQETPAPRPPSGVPSNTTMSSQRSRHMPPYYVSRDDDAISKRRRGGGGYYVEGAASYSHGGGSRAAGGPTSQRRHEQTSERRLAPPAMMNGEIGERSRPRNRRRRRRHGGNQNDGHDQRMQQGYRAREQPQRGRRGQERPPSGHCQVFRWPHLGNAPPNVSTPPQEGSSDYRPSHSGPHGREDSHRRRQSRVQEPPKIGGHHHHREAPAFSSPYQAHGREDSLGGRPNPAAQERGPNASGAYQQRKAPRRRGRHVPVRPYHPYARDAGAFDGAGNQARHESRPNNYWHRRDDARKKTGGRDRSRRRYGEVQK